MGINFLGFLDSCERYSFEAKKWEDLPNLPIAMDGWAATAVGNSVYVIGGFTMGWPTNRVFRLDTVQLAQWEEVAHMGQKRDSGSAVARNDGGAVGQIVVTGGLVNGVDLSSSCEQYEPATNTWRPFPNMQRAKYNHQLVEYGGELFAIGGYDDDDLMSMGRALR